MNLWTDVCTEHKWGNLWGIVKVGSCYENNNRSAWSDCALLFLVSFFGIECIAKPAHVRVQRAKRCSGVHKKENHNQCNENLDLIVLCHLGQIVDESCMNGFPVFVKGAQIPRSTLQPFARCHCSHWCELARTYKCYPLGGEDRPKLPDDMTWSFWQVPF